MKVTKLKLFSFLCPLLICACGGGPDPSAQDAQPSATDDQDQLMVESEDGSTTLAAGAAGAGDLILGSTVHKLPLKTFSASRVAPLASSDLTYYGGPVISNVQVWTVYWNDKTLYQSELNDFYSGITNSAYVDWLSEYDTPTQKIRRGGLGGAIVDTGAPTKKSVTDADIQTELSRLIDAGQLPANHDGNQLYAVHFPPGVSITEGGQGSCQAFCAYHGTFQKTLTASSANPQGYHYYSVLPDQGGACAGGCGDAPDQFSNTTSVASHELIEAVTDAAVGLATTEGPPLAWYNSSQGEIGDICNAQQGTVGQWVVQKQWSNKSGACVTTRGGSTCTPSCNNKTCGSDDGCGSACQAGSGCTQACTPQCSGTTCGNSDGCGGTCTAGSGCTNPTGGSEQEPNNSRSAANPLSFGGTLSGAVRPTSDKDYFHLRPKVGDHFSVTLSQLTGNCDVRLYNSSGKLLQVSNNLGTQDDFIVYTAQTKNYYVKVSAASSGVTCDYSLSAKLQ